MKQKKLIKFISHQQRLVLIGLQAVNSDIKCETFKLVKAT